MRLLHIPLLGLLLVLLVGTSCRATRDSNTASDEASSTADAVVSYLHRGAEDSLPTHTVRLTLPPVSPIEDFRVELFPALPNEEPGMMSLDARLVPGEQLGDFSTYYYAQGEGKLRLIDPLIHGLAPKPLLFGEPLILPFRGNKELALVTNDSIRIAYRYWKAMGKAQEVQPASGLKELKSKKGYRAYQVFAPERSRQGSATYYIELIPSRQMEVDCNIHVLNGKFELDLDTQGINLPYIFVSDGSTMSTRMGCPDAKREKRLVRHMGVVVLRDAGEPVTIYLPTGFSLLYRIYAPEGKTRLIADQRSLD